MGGLLGGGGPKGMLAPPLKLLGGGAWPLPLAPPLPTPMFYHDLLQAVEIVSFSGSAFLVTEAIFVF